MPCEQTVQIICADPQLAREYLSELGRTCEPHHLVLAHSAAEARREPGDSGLAVVLLDESAVATANAGALESALGILNEGVPIVVVAAAERQSELAFLITSGAVDFVARAGHSVKVAAGMVARRLRLAECVAGLRADDDPSDDFGEILRHEVNNPLTGILGNAELLLARRDALSPSAAARVETIAELAVRLRETVRRLSNAWIERNDHVASR